MLASFFFRTPRVDTHISPKCREGITKAPASLDDQRTTIFLLTHQNHLQNPFGQSYALDKVILEALDASISGNQPAVLEYVVSFLHPDYIKAFLHGEIKLPRSNESREIR